MSMLLGYCRQTHPYIKEKAILPPKHKQNSKQIQAFIPPITSQYKARQWFLLTQVSKKPGIYSSYHKSVQSPDSHSSYHKSISQNTVLKIQIGENEPYTLVYMFCRLSCKTLINCRNLKLFHNTESVPQNEIVVSPFSVVFRDLTKPKNVEACLIFLVSFELPNVRRHKTHVHVYRIIFCRTLKFGQNWTYHN